MAESAHVSISPGSLDFGSVTVGSQKTISLRIGNDKGSTATVSQISTSGAGFSLTSPATTPFTLSPGQTATLDATFTPASAGLAMGSISVVISGGPSPVPTALTGIGLAANLLGLTPTTMDFGDTKVGASQSQTGLLTAGISSITVSSADWSGAGYSLSGITFPVTIPAGQSVPFTVTFNPQTTGLSTGTVSFVNDASNTPASETLTGSGIQQQHSVDLVWSPSTSAVIGYNVYRGTQTGGPYALLNAAVEPATSYTDSSVLSGETYFYVVTSVDSSSQESAFSGETTAVIPAP